MKKIIITTLMFLVVGSVAVQESFGKTPIDLSEKDPQSDVSRESVIELLVKVEQSAGELYKLYAEIFPELKDFWNSLAVEEEGHAFMVAKLYVLPDEYKVYPKDDNKLRFNADYVRGVLGYIKFHLSAAKKAKISLEQAFDAATDIEESLVEKNFYSVFEGDGPAAKEILSLMVYDSKRHGQKIKEMREKIKNKK